MIGLTGFVAWGTAQISTSQPIALALKNLYVIKQVRISGRLIYAPESLISGAHGTDHSFYAAILVIDVVFAIPCPCTNYCSFSLTDVYGNRWIVLMNMANNISSFQTMPQSQYLVYRPSTPYFAIELMLVVCKNAHYSYLHNSIEDVLYRSNFR